MSVPIFVTVFLVLHGGFYLGYLRGRIFPQNAQLPPPNILLSLQYISNLLFLEKSSRHDQVSAHEVSILCLRTLHDKEHDYD